MFDELLPSRRQYHSATTRTRVATPHSRKPKSSREAHSPFRRRRRRSQRACAIGASAPTKAAPTRGIAREHLLSVHPLFFSSFPLFAENPPTSHRATGTCAMLFCHVWRTAAEMSSLLVAVVGECAAARTANRNLFRRESYFRRVTRLARASRPNTIISSSVLALFSFSLLLHFSLASPPFFSLDTSSFAFLFRPVRFLSAYISASHAVAALFPSPRSNFERLAYTSRICMQNQNREKEKEKDRYIYISS